MIDSNCSGQEFSIINDLYYYSHFFFFYFLGRRMWDETLLLEYESVAQEGAHWSRRAQIGQAHAHNPLLLFLFGQEIWIQLHIAYLYYFLKKKKKVVMLYITQISY
jgi:hypothetical protein